MRGAHTVRGASSTGSTDSSTAAASVHADELYSAGEQLQQLSSEVMSLDELHEAQLQHSPDGFWCCPEGASLLECFLAFAFGWYFLLCARPPSKPGREKN